MAWNPFRKRRPGAAARPHEVKQSGSGGFIALHMQGTPTWSSRDYAALARLGYMRNPVVHRAIRMISEAAAYVPWLLYDGVTELDEHPLIDVLTRPNPRQSAPSFMEVLYGHLMLSGNAYLEHVPLSDAAAELHLLRPDRTRLAIDETGWPEALEVSTGSVKRRIRLQPAGQDAAALHVCLFHPLDDHYGFPPLEAALMALDTHNASGTWNKALLDNSARPSGALVYQPKDGANLTEEQFQRLKQELEEGYSGSGQAGRPLLLEGGLDWKAMSLTPKDMDFMEARNGAARDIALAFGIPPMLLGIPGDNTYANYQEANRAFYRQTVLPLVARMAREFTQWLAPAHGGTLRFEPDLDRIEALALEREALWGRLSKAPFLTDDEKREAVGYQPRPGMDDDGRWS